MPSGSTDTAKTIARLSAEAAARGPTHLTPENWAAEEERRNERGIALGIKLGAAARKNSAEG